MNQEETLIRLQEELQQLQQQNRMQAEQIKALQNRLQALLPATASQTTTVKPDLPDFSLENFIGLRLIHFIGIVVLVIGLSIGVKYAIDRNLISEGMRIGLAYAAGVALFVTSLKLRRQYSLFSAILLSGGMASLYFTTYAAFVFYGMLPFALAYGLMVLLTLYTVYTAIQYNLQLVALLGLIGAYAIPFLISPNTGNPNLFFLYILLINAGALFLALRQQWTATAVAAMAVTWLLYFGWLLVRAQADWRLTGWFFLLLFYSLFYTYLLLATKITVAAVRLVMVLVGNAALYFGALALMPDIRTGSVAALISLAMCGWLLVQAACFHYLRRDALLKLRLLYWALSFFVLFIALYWSGMAVTLLWLLTGVLIFAGGVWLKAAAFRIAAIVLMALTLGKLVLVDSAHFSAEQKVICYVLLGVLLLAISFFYQKFKARLFGEATSKPG